MKLIRFTYTNDYDARSEVYVNPAFVVTLRSVKGDRTSIGLASKAEITVDGTIAVVATQLCGDYGPETVDIVKETG